MRADAGTSLIETLIVGFAVVLLVGQGIVTLGRLEAAGTAAEEAARYAATSAARHGSGPEAARLAMDLLPSARVEVYERPGAIEVVVSVAVVLVGPEFSPLTRQVTGRATVPISPYRSRP